jgi:general stress protein 26
LRLIADAPADRRVGSFERRLASAAAGREAMRVHEDPGRTHDDDAPSEIARLRTRIAGLPVAMVTAIDGQGMPSTRPLKTQEFDDNGVLWFFVSSEGTLARGVEHNPRVNVSYSDPGHGLYVAISGYARLVYDPERIFALWEDGLETWFEEGPLDRRLAILRIDIDQAEYWAEGSRGVIRLIALAHAALRREAPQPAAEHSRLTLRSRNGESARAA